MINNMDIITITGIITLVIFMLVVVYYLIYKRKINKAFKDGKPMKKTMPAFSTAALLAWFVIWTISTAFMMYQIQTSAIEDEKMEEKLSEVEKNIEDRISSGNEYIGNRVDNILYTVNTQSLIYDYKFEKGDFHADDNTVDVRISIKPKTAGKNDILRFKMGDSEIGLKKQENGYYTGTLRTDIFKADKGGIFTIESDGRLFYESVWKNSSSYNDNWTQYFPYVQTELTSNSDDEDIFYINAYPSEYDKKRKFTELELECVINNTTVDKTDLLHDRDVAVKSEDNGTQYMVSRNIKANVYTDEMRFYINARDTEGCTYRIMFWNNKELSFYEQLSSSYIKDNKNNVIIKFNGHGDYTDGAVIDINNASVYDADE